MTAPRPLKALLSIHDVMPETLEVVQGCLDRLKAHGLPSPILLVVPGRDWQPDQLAQLRTWQAAGCELAAHGWVHEVVPRRLYHRFHALLLSRTVAEHLDLDADGIVDLMRRSLEWFPANALPAPRFYVPPAWALGRVSWPQLTELPVRHLEILAGIVDLPHGSLRRLPLVGFETDTLWRATFVRVWNWVQVRRARSSGRPLRIGLHPHDFDLLLKDSLERLLREPGLTLVHLDVT